MNCSKGPVREVKSCPDRIYKTTMAGNSTMIHLLLQIPPASIRLAPLYHSSKSSACDDSRWNWV